MADENAVYKYYGGGNKEDGKKTLRQLYVVNQAISYVVEKANITVEPGYTDDRVIGKLKGSIKTTKG